MPFLSLRHVVAFKGNGRCKPSVRYGLRGYFSISSNGQRFKTTAGVPNLTHAFHWRWKDRRFQNFSAPKLSRRVSSVSALINRSSTSALLFVVRRKQMKVRDEHAKVWSHRIDVEHITHAGILKRSYTVGTCLRWQTWQRSSNSGDYMSTIM